MAKPNQKRTVWAKRFIQPSRYRAIFLAFVMIVGVMLFQPLERLFGQGAFLILTLIAAMFFGVCLQLVSRRRQMLYILMFLLLPVATFQMVEVFNDHYIWQIGPTSRIVNYLLYLAVYTLFFCLTGRLRATVWLSNVIAFVFGLVNYFVLLHKGVPLLPMDIFAWRTALEVAGGYSFAMSKQIALALAYLVSLLVIGSLLKREKLLSIKQSLLLRGVMALSLVGSLSFAYGTSYMNDHYMRPNFWNQVEGYESNGIFYNFFVNSQFMHVSPPDDYDAKKVRSRLEAYLQQRGLSLDDATSANMLTGGKDYVPSGKHPNIIAIMNESWADFGMIGDVQTDVDPLAFTHSLTDNTIKGTLNVSVFGGGTAVSEFEFLTSNTQAFMPPGSNAYSANIHREMPSLVTALSEQGYSNVAFHPHFAESWDRPEGYYHLGFSKFITLEDMIEPEILSILEKNPTDYEKYIAKMEEVHPDEDILVRQFVSDAYDFRYLEKLYEERDTSKPFFLFNVTVQNHGGYGGQISNFQPDVHITNLKGSYPGAEFYLSLDKKTDEAFKQLIEYFQQVEEPTVILMFGDHQPSVENAFYEEVLQKDLKKLGLSEYSKRFRTPFIIWANYDIAESEKPLDISANYLAPLLMQVAGQELNDYQKYLAALYQEFPVISLLHYKTADGTMYRHRDAGPGDEALADYQALMYNDLIDVKYRDWSLYTLNGQALPPLRGSYKTILGKAAQ